MMSGAVAFKTVVKGTGLRILVWTKKFLFVVICEAILIMTC